MLISWIWNISFFSLKFSLLQKKTQNLHFTRKKKIKNKVENAKWNNTFGKWYGHAKHSLPKENQTALSAISDFQATTTLIP